MINKSLIEISVVPLFPSFTVLCSQTSELRSHFGCFPLEPRKETEVKELKCIALWLEPTTFIQMNFSKRFSHQSVVKLESTNVVSWNVSCCQGFWYLSHNATFICKKAQLLQCIYESVINHIKFHHDGSWHLSLEPLIGGFGQWWTE